MPDMQQRSGAAGLLQGMAAHRLKGWVQCHWPTEQPLQCCNIMRLLFQPDELLIERNPAGLVQAWAADVLKETL
jgi:hypothetical protein